MVKSGASGVSRSYIPDTKPLTSTKQKLRTGELTVSGDQWPVFLYRSCKYDDDDPWHGLLQSSILVKVGRLSAENFIITDVNQAFRHIFTSPSSVEKEAKATRSGNARIHGMARVTPASVAYAATQVYFSRHPSFSNHNPFPARLGLHYRRQESSLVPIPPRILNDSMAAFLIF